MTFPQIVIRFTALAIAILLLSSAVSVETRLVAGSAGFIDVAPAQGNFSAVQTMASTAESTIQGLYLIDRRQSDSEDPVEGLMRANLASAIDAAPEVSVSTLRYTAEASVVVTAN